MTCWGHSSAARIRAFVSGNYSPAGQGGFGGPSRSGVGHAGAASRPRGSPRSRPRRVPEPGRTRAARALRRRARACSVRRPRRARRRFSSRRARGLRAVMASWPVGSRCTSRRNPRRITVQDECFLGDGSKRSGLRDKRTEVKRGMRPRRGRSAREVLGCPKLLTLGDAPPGVGPRGPAGSVPGRSNRRAVDEQFLL